MPEQYPRTGHAREPLRAATSARGNTLIIAAGFAHREVLANTDFEAGLTIPAVVFVGVVGAKHQCRPATDEDLQGVKAELPLQTPPFFKYGWQRLCEVLVEVMGA